MQMEDRLPGAGTDVDHHLVVVQPGGARRVGHEHQHRARLLWREVADVSECLDVTFRDDEKMRVGLRVDVVDRDEAVGGVDVLAVTEEGIVAATSRRLDGGERV